jgi:hypothetical protein
MPALFGQTMAAYTLCELAGGRHSLSNSVLVTDPLQRPALAKLQVCIFSSYTLTYSVLTRFLQRRFQQFDETHALTNTVQRGTTMDIAEVRRRQCCCCVHALFVLQIDFVANEVWRNRSALTPDKPYHRLGKRGVAMTVRHVYGSALWTL